ncbi:MAG: HupE/UreJ family protein [Pseudomonadota bacterium]|nr:HupE/UreJ family protein [Pseudomonadota bacterium]
MTESSDSQVQVELDIALKDVALTLPIDQDNDRNITWAELLQVRPDLEALVREGLTVTRGGTTCRMAGSQLGIRRYEDGVYAALVLTAACPSAGALAVDYRLFFDRDPMHRSLVTMRTGAASLTAIASASDSRLEGPGGSGASSSVSSFLREGIHHILIGYDHLAFLALLLLPVVLRRSDRRWDPVDGFRPALLRAAGIVTAFTVAHSITLTSAAMGWLSPPTRWVEAVIAASVVLAAANNIWPLITRRLFLLAFGFGLVHGFGFAGVLAEVGIPREARVASLLGFNLGVEIGQLAVVAFLLPLLFLVRKRSWYPSLGLRGASAAVGLLASWWLFERLA